MTLITLERLGQPSDTVEHHGSSLKIRVNAVFRDNQAVKVPWPGFWYVDEGKYSFREVELGGLDSKAFDEALRLYCSTARGTGEGLWTLASSPYHFRPVEPSELNQELLDVAIFTSWSSSDAVQRQEGFHNPQIRELTSVPDVAIQADACVMDVETDRVYLRTHLPPTISEFVGGVALLPLANNA